MQKAMNPLDAVLGRMKLLRYFMVVLWLQWRILFSQKAYSEINS